MIKSNKLLRSTNVNRELNGLKKTPLSAELQEVLFTVIQSVSVLFFGLVKVKATPPSFETIPATGECTFKLLEEGKSAAHKTVMLFNKSTY